MTGELTWGLLRKGAADNGFDVESGQVSVGDRLWLSFFSSRAPLRVWMTCHGAAGPYLLALSGGIDASMLGEVAGAGELPLPPGAVVGLWATDLGLLHNLLRRAYQLSRSLPESPLQRFQHQTAGLPRTTEAERLVIARVGQETFREALLDYWDGRCAITGLDVPELLRASHIRPWAHCDTDNKRLDVFNGLLLAPHLDAVFDKGFITISDEGQVIISETLGPAARQLLGLEKLPQLARVEPQHRHYLGWHRQRVFRRDAV